MTLRVTWIDRRAHPKVKPNPAYPHGIDIDVSGGAKECCYTPLPCPARRIGFYFVECDACGQNALITTAGRPDDPRSIKMGCRK